MTVNGWIQIPLFCAVVAALVKPLGGYMTRVFDGERTLPVAGACGRSSAASTASRRRRAREQHWLDLRGRHAAVQRRRLPAPLRAAAAAGRAAAQPGRHGRRSRRSSPSTPPSASSPTPTGRTTAARRR